ncbi:MAG: TonB-dependent receptor [Acidocella sp.]|nr:TonB-dependent receptor [Acidocella sp.]
MALRSALRAKVSTRALIVGAVSGLLVTAPALAQNAVSTSTNSTINLDLGSVLAQGADNDDGDASTPGTPANEAPTHGSLKETQPTSVISQKYVQDTMPPTVNYSDIMNIAPSASSTNQAGPGLYESKHTEMRGFQDGQFNVTFDGIPYGDSNDFTHHTTSFFMENDIGETIVDRGPGTASTVGNATFGGTVAIVSKDPLAQRTITPYATYGSYETYVAGTELDTGVFGPYGTSAFVDGEYAGSNTYDQNSKIARSNVFGKVVQPLAHNFVLTVVSMYNDTYQQIPGGGTLADLAAYGPTFGLSNNPLDQNYSKYNTDHYKTDFSYIDLRGVLGDGWTVDSKIYTYAYYHHSLNGEDTLACSTDQSNCVNINNLDLGKLAGGNTLSPANGTIVPGQFSNNTYRSVGTISRVQKDFSVLNMSGDLKFGVWYDHQENSRYLTDQNLVTGINLLPGTGTSVEPYNRLMHDTLDTFQPYVQIDFHPFPGLTISPGVKYDYFKRGINAPIDQKTFKPLGYEAVYAQPVPSVEVNYQISPVMSVYAQYAEGFLAPNLNVLYSTNPSVSNNLQPQTTQNYQAGVVYQSNKFAGDADVYYIPFSNLASKTTINGATAYINGGGAIYEGVEAEGTYALGHHLDIYANGSLNSANYAGDHGKTANHVAETPQATWAAALIYDDGTFNASISDKWTGGKYGGDSPDIYWMNPYNLVNVSAGLDLPHGYHNAPPIKLSLNLDNLTNQTQIYDYNGTLASLTPTQPGDAKGTAIFLTIPGRSIFLNVSIPLAF